LQAWWLLPTKKGVTWSLRPSPGPLALILSAVFGVGCNFEGTLYAEQYREQGDRICAQFAQEVARIPAPSSSGNYRRYLRRRAVVADAELSRVQATIE